MNEYNFDHIAVFKMDLTLFTTALNRSNYNSDHYDDLEENGFM